MPAPIAGPPRPERLVALDAFRGAIMLLMASGGLGIPQIAKGHPDSPLWKFLGTQCEHAAWTGCTLWDLIQPAFMFMVGVALPWSLANRAAQGQGEWARFGHAVRRALVLVLLGVFLTSAWSKSTDWVFPNVLCQIGLGYPFLFLLAFLPTHRLGLAIAAILIGYTAFFVLHPLPPADFNWQAVGVPPDGPHLQGYAAHWEKNANAAATFDLWFLNLFPRETTYTHNSGGYQTLNFVPSIATMALGVVAGRILRSDLPRGRKLRQLALIGVVLLVAGQFLAWTVGGPIVKRIWSPTWALFSGGWVFLLLAAFVALIEGREVPRWAFPLVVAGLNPITLYCLWQLSSGFIRERIKTHFGQEIFASLGTEWTPMLERASVLLVFWLILLWMHRRKLYIRI